MYIKPKTLFLTGFFIFILAIHLWAIATSGYYYIWWLDMVPHFLGGFWLGSMGIYLFLRMNFELNSRAFVFLILLALVSLGGVFWEFFEYGYDKIFAARGLGPLAQIDIGDTMGDLFLDLLGGILAHFIFLKGKTSRK